MAVSELIVKLIGDVSGFQKTMNQVGKEVTRTGRSISTSGEVLTKAFSVPLAAIATGSLVLAANFQSAMSKVSALSGITGNDLKKLEDQALALGASTQFSATEAAEGMAEFASAGFNNVQIGESIAGAMDLAAAAQISVGQASNITATTLGQFNLKADQAGDVANIMAKGAATGALTIVDLAESLKYVGPIANTMGISLNDTTAAISALSNAGIKGSEAGTALRMGLLRMVKPTKQAQEAIDKYNLSLVDSQGKSVGMIEVIKQLESKHVSLADLTKLVGVNAVTAWAALQKAGSDSLTAVTAKVADHDNAAKEMAATLRNNLKGSFEQMSGAVETLGISIGMALTPAATLLMSVIQKLAEKGVELVTIFRNLDPNLQNAIIAFGIIVGVIGPAALIIGKLTMAVGGFIKMLGTMKTAITLLTSATGIGLIAIALGLAVAAAVYFKDDLSKVFEIVSKVVVGFYDKFMEVLTKVKTSVWPTIGPIVTYFVKLVSEIAIVISVMAETFMDLFTEILSIAANFVVSLIEVVSKILDWTSEFAIIFIKAFSLAFTTITDTAIDFTVEVLKLVTGLFESLVTVVSEGMKMILDYFGITGNDILNFWNGLLDSIKSGFLFTVDIIISALGKLQSAVGVVSDSAAAAIGDLKASIEQLRKPTEAAKIEIKKTEVAVVDLSKASKDQQKVISDLKAEKGKDTKATVDNKKAIEDASKSLGINSEGTNKNADAKKKVTKESKEEAKARKESEKAAKEEAKQLDENTEKLRNIVEASQEYKDIQKKLADGSITQAEAGKKIFEMYDKVAAAVGDLEEAEAKYHDAVKARMTGGNISAEEMAEYAKQLEIAKTKVEELKGAEGELGKGKTTQEAMKDFAKNVEDQLASAIGSAVTAGLTGGSISKIGKEFAGQIAGEFGAVVGAAFGGPIGAAIGQALGTAVGEKLSDNIAQIGKSTAGTIKGLLSSNIITAPFALVGDGIIDSMFGESKGTAIRKAVDKWFADAFDKNRVMLVINGQLQQIKDLDLGGANFGNPNSAAGQAFSGLSQMAQDAFGGVAIGFADMMGLGQETAQGIAIALSSNVGGSLNNLQIMIDGLGLSFEDMEKVVVTAFLNGKLSFLEAQKALNGLAQVAQKGIPDAVGATVLAFNNLKDAGIKGGRVSTDALRDIAYEAKELGIKTLPALMANLVASGKLSKDEINKLFSALSSQGIDSIDKLTSATDTKLIAVLAKLQETKFPFADAIDDAKGLTDAINQMPKSKDITFNLKTNLDSNTKAAMEAGLVPSTGGARIESRSITQNAQGNAYSAGSIIPFAKGGVVSKFTTFDMGSMAERGPEAIMPLERLPDGSLGVRSASQSGSEEGGTSIVINAPYASPGIVETIRRELDKFADSRNRVPGIRR